MWNEWDDGAPCDSINRQQTDDVSPVASDFQRKTKKNNKSCNNNKNVQELLMAEKCIMISLGRKVRTWEKKQTKKKIL